MWLKFLEGGIGLMNMDDDVVEIGETSVLSRKMGLGTNKVGKSDIYKDVKDADGFGLVKKAIDSGMTTIDTAYAYGKGRSEEIIGDVIKHYDRSDIVIATKAAQDPERDYAINNSPEFLKKSVDQALERLKVDYIDIFYIHFPDKDTPKAEALSALEDMREADKIKAIGVSNFTLDQIKEANIDGFVDVVEDNYSLVHRNAEKELFPYLRENNISFVPYFPLASGTLTGKYQASDYAKVPRFSKEEFGQIVTSLDPVKKIAAKYDATVTQLLLAWYMMDPDISIVIPGARTVEQVEQNAKSWDIHLSKEDYQAIDTAFSDFK